MTAHSVLAPSSSARRVQCPASTKAEAMFPDGDRQDAADGEAAHWALAEMLHGNVVAEGQYAPNGVILTVEMIEGAEVMFDDVCRELAPYGLPPRMGRIESTLRIPRVHPESFGTPDFYIWLTAPDGVPLLLLYDFKFGHRYVPAYENHQCIEYVAGALDERGITGGADQGVRVRVKIVQPRSYHRDGPVREWAFTASDIRAHINVASNAAHAALSPDPEARTGSECRDCKARHACPTLQRSSYAAADESSREAPHELPPEALAIELRIVAAAMERLKARHSGLEQQALSLLKNGRKLPGWATEFGAGRKRWTKPDAAVIQVGQMVGVNLARPVEAMTPTQAEKAGFPLALFPGLVESPRGAAALVPDDGSRAQRVFGTLR